MRKVILALCAIILCVSCRNNDTSDTITIDNDYVISDKNNSRLLSIDNITHYGKYYDKDWENMVSIKGVYLPKALEFINTGSTLNDAYNHILYFFQNKNNIDYTNFNQYCDPFPYNYDVSNKQCLENKEESINAYIKTNQSLLKARNMIKEALNSHIPKAEESAEIALAYEFIALSYIAEDGFYEFPEIKSALSSWKKYGGKKVTLFSNKELNENLTKLFSYIAYTDNIGVGELLIEAKKTKTLEYVRSKGGYYDYFNDGYYTIAGISQIDGLYRVNSFYPEYKNQTLTPNVIKKLIPSNKADSAVNYEFKTIYSDAYEDELWLVPFDSAVFLLIANDDNFIKLEFRNTAYIDTSYREIDKDYVENSGLPLIVNIHNYKLTQKDFMVFSGDKGSFIWNGDIVNQKPNPKKLFTLVPSFDCTKKDVNSVEICKSREKLILAKYVHFLKCGTKKNCTISPHDVNKYMNTQGLL